MLWVARNGLAEIKHDLGVGILVEQSPASVVVGVGCCSGIEADGFRVVCDRAIDLAVPEVGDARLLWSPALPEMSEIRREQARMASEGFSSCSQSRSGLARARSGNEATIAAHRSGTSVQCCKTDDRASLTSICALPLLASTSNVQRRQGDICARIQERPPSNTGDASLAAADTSLRADATRRSGSSTFSSRSS
jgi:hypothetical protein